MGYTEKWGAHRLSYGCSVEKRQDADLGLSESLRDHSLSPQTNPKQGLGDIELERGAIPGHQSLELSGWAATRAEVSGIEREGLLTGARAALAPPGS